VIGRTKKSKNMINFKSGLPVTASFWGEKVTAGVGLDVDLYKDHMMVDSQEDNSGISDDGTQTYHLRETYTTVSKIGKFSFDVWNPYQTDISVTITVYGADHGMLLLDQNAQHSSILSGTGSETFEIYLAGKGAWYLWVHSCTGTLQLTIADSPDDLDKQKQGDTNKKVRAGQQHLYRLQNEKSGMKYVRLTRDPESKVDSQFLLSTSFFEETKLYNFDAGSIPLTVENEFTYHMLSSSVKVKFSQAQLNKLDANDDVIYQVTVCPTQNKKNFEIQNVCMWPIECSSAQVTYRIREQPQTIEMNIDGLIPGKYYVQITARIQHMKKFVKFISFPVTNILIEKPLFTKITEMMGTILLGSLILAIVAFVIFKCFKRLKEMGDDRGFELQMFGKKKPEYGMLGEDY
jgi:hypothetical protein